MSLKITVPKILFSILVVLCTFPARFGSASSLQCADIAGAKVYGWNGKSYVFVGTVSAEQAETSIYNPKTYGAKNFEMSLVTSFNKSLTSDFSDSSALNTNASRPPFVLGRFEELIAFVSANPLKTPRITHEELLGCAKRSKGKAMPVAKKRKNLAKVPGRPNSASAHKVCKEIYGEKAVPLDVGCTCLTGFWMRDAKCVEPELFCKRTLGEGSRVNETATGCSCESDPKKGSEGNYSFELKSGKCMRLPLKNIDHVVKNWVDNSGRCALAVHFSKKQKNDCIEYSLFHQKYSWNVITQERKGSAR